MSGPTTAFITGATEGIGRAIALSLGRQGYRIGVCARREATLELLLTELEAQGIAVTFQDHDISHAIYFYDPDGHQLEITTYELE